MSPRSATFLTALGLLAAGAPLPFLMHTHEESEHHHHHHACCGHEHHEHTADKHATEYRVPATIRCSAPLTGLEIRLGDRILYQARDCGMESDFTLTLPAADSYELEIFAGWINEDPQAEAPQALSLPLDVPRRETRTVTQWDVVAVHTIFRFSW